MPDRYMTAHQAADYLNVSVGTIYSYVSRGLIRSEPDDDTRRTHRYRATDIERLKQRQRSRRDPDRRAEGALHWGAAVIESAITLIKDGRLYYRGKDALTLAAGAATYEEVAALLWESSPDLLYDAQPPSITLPDLPQFSIISRMQIALMIASTEDLTGYDLRSDAIRRTGVRIVKILAAVLAPDGGQTISQSLYQAWGLTNPQHQDLIEMALILCADHELNVSAFTARAVASSHATPYQAVIAGLGALSGARHGGYTARVEALLDEVRTPNSAPHTIRSRMQRGDSLPGFRHHLYPDGDPRAQLLLDTVREVAGDHPAVQLADAITDAVYSATGDHPTIDLGLVTVSRILDIQEGGIALFALGRSAGWIAHAIEGAQGSMIRPRARYTGPSPAEPI